MGFHKPVLVQEVKQGLRPRAGMSFVDGTAGHGGHMHMLLEETAPDGVVIGIDRDQRNLDVAQKRLASFGDRAIVIRGNYRHLDQILDDLEIVHVHGILLDVGFSSAHVNDPERGFSFQQTGPLDMRYDSDQGLTAEEIVNSWPEAKLSELFFHLGEERRARQIAKAIRVRRKKERFRTTTDLAAVIADVVPRRGPVHPATRVFQALRIAVNDELGALEEVLPKAVSALADGGRIAVISFHSLEDRIVKRFFKREPQLQVITKKPVVASVAERKANPRARSAKLRLAEKTNKNYDNRNTHTAVGSPTATTDGTS